MGAAFSGANGDGKIPHATARRNGPGSGNRAPIN